MSQIKASPESVRKLAADLRKTIKNLQDISAQVRSSGNVSGWSDSQGQEFKSVVNRISGLTQSPINTLESAIPRLNRIADALEKYNGVKF
ncbi:MAG: WXG100 family type VII secretion target [Clostridia bacterium]|nr:WXG100 family type VII secretion target [Clostridia bacterium]